MFCSVCGAKNFTGVINALFCGSCGNRFSTAGPSMASNSLSFEEFMTQRASGGDQTFFSCAVKKADKVKKWRANWMAKKGKKSVMNKFRYNMLIEYLWLSFQRCYLFREVMQAMSNTVQNNFNFFAKGNECV